MRISKRSTMQVLAFAAVLALPLVAGACGGGRKDGSLPSYVYKSSHVLHGYQFALGDRGASLGYVPCYCGCGQAPEYANLRDCFVGPEGTREHAAECQVCLDEAKDVEKWLEDGKSMKQIRAEIDAKYGDVGPPTHTPPVPDNVVI